MFLLPSVLLAIVVARVLGGRLSQVMELELRAPWLVLVALLDQIVLFSRVGEAIPALPARVFHLGSYALLIMFAVLNRRQRALLPLLAGMLLNATAILANGGRMPASEGAVRAAGLSDLAGSNVSEGARHLRFLGDVFALPRELPFANVFSVGDVLIGAGMIVFVVLVSLDGGDAPPLSAARLVAPLRRPAFRTLAAGKLLSQIGDWVTLAALIGWIYETSGSTSQVAAVLALRLAPSVLGGSIAALVVDRLPKGKLLVVIEVLRGLMVLAAFCGVWAGSRPIVFASLALSGVLAALTAAALPSIVPSLLPPEEYGPANAGLGIAENAAMAIGSLAAGLALATVDVKFALAADIGTFALAALVYARLDAVPVPSVRGGGSVRDGLRYVLRHRRLTLLIGVFGAATLATGLTNATLPRFLDGATQFGAAGYGFAFAALSLGLAGGHATAGFARIDETAYRWIGAGLVGMAGLLALLALTAHGPTALLLLAAVGFVDGTTDVLFETAVQRDVSPAHYGTVFGAAGAFVTGTMMLSVVAAPALNGALSPRLVLLGASVVLVAAGALALGGAALARSTQRLRAAPTAA